MKREKKRDSILILFAALVVALSMGISAYAETGEEEAAAVAFTVAASVTGHDIGLTWEAAEGADYYRVFDRDGNELTSEEGPLDSSDSTTTGDGGAQFSYTIADAAGAETAYEYTVNGYALPTDTEPAVSAKTSVKIWHKPSVPAISSAKFTSATNAKIIWKAVDHADTYKVWRKAGSGAWTELTATTGTYYNDSTAKLGTTYRYAIEAVSDCCGITSGRSATGTAASYVAATKVTGVSAISQTQVQVKWNAVSGASGYYVYAKVGSGAWKKVSTVSSGLSYKYKLSTSYWGKTVSFKVYPYCSSYTSLASNTASTVFKPAKVTLKKAAVHSYKSNQITWKQLSGASGYKVYRKTSGGSWKLLKTITKGTTLSYTDSKAALGKTYYYTVKGYWKSGTKTQDGYYDAKGVSVKTAVKAPQGIAAKVKYDKVTISWKKVAGAQGYRIYRKVSGGKYVKVATVKSSKLSYMDRFAATGKSYQYTVKAYRKSGKTIHWSAAGTATKSVKTPVITKYKKVTDKKSIMYGKTVKLYYDLKGKQIQNTQKYVGKPGRYYLYINKSKQYVTAYCKDGKYYVPVRAMVCSTGKVMSDTPNGTFKTKNKYRWRELVGKCWGQYCTRITGRILFHSVYYKKYNNPKQLAVAQYNKLGTRASAGCVRLAVKDSKWIYSNCKLKTTTVIHQKTGYEPLAKPKGLKLKASHKWDPTDPNLKYLCKRYECH